MSHRCITTGDKVNTVCKTPATVQSILGTQPDYVVTQYVEQ